MNLNEISGTTINELEATLKMVSKLLQDKIDEDAKGVVFAKGKKNELKLTYKRALKVVSSIDKHFGYKGCDSYGICATCTKFDTTKFQDNEFGYCGGDMKHKYDTCQNHSKQGGGFGL